MFDNNLGLMNLYTPKLKSKEFLEAAKDIRMVWGSVLEEERE